MDVGSFKEDPRVTSSTSAQASGDNRQKDRSNRFSMEVKPGGKKS